MQSMKASEISRVANAKLSDIQILTTIQEGRGQVATWLVLQQKRSALIYIMISSTIEPESIMASLSWDGDMTEIR